MVYYYSSLEIYDARYKVKPDNFNRGTSIEMSRHLYRNCRQTNKYTALLAYDRIVPNLQSAPAIHCMHTVPIA